MGKTFFRECFGCYCGHKCKKQRLPRKKKKQYKKFRLIIDQYRHGHIFCDVPTICNISDDYKRDRPLFQIIHFLKEFDEEIKYLRKICSNNGEGIYLNDNGRLAWYWEYDDDYCGSSGLMDLCYNEKDAGRTWAFSEVKNTVRYIFDYPENFVFPEEINSDKSLLLFIRKHIKNHEEGL